MNASRRRAIGLAVAIALLTTLAIYSAWRLEFAARRGWAGGNRFAVTAQAG